MESDKRLVPLRGEIYLVELDPTVGAEIQKTRPAVIIQNDIYNRYGNITIVAAITSNTSGKNYPTNVFIPSPEGGLSKDSIIKTNQIRSIDKQRLIKKFGILRPETMNKVDEALKISLALIEI